MDDTLRQLSLYLLQTLGGIYVFVALLRVWLQVGRADYYNPISQLVVRLTQGPVQGLARLVPAWGRIDLAAIFWVLIVQVILIEALALASGVGVIDLFTALAWAAIGSLNLLLDMLFWGMLILIVLSFTTLLGGGPLRHPVLDLLEQLMAPVSVPLQRILPPMGGLDLSPILLFMGIGMGRILLDGLAGGVGIESQLVVGF
ncbi:MAG: YggT family protein [Cellvibrionales bacterium]|nr:YggT family protein [Cellvibrionales bacterium]